MPARVEDIVLNGANMNPSNTKEDVVISGIGCRMPESENIEEFRENLINGIDMITENDRRWEPGWYNQ